MGVTIPTAVTVTPAELTGLLVWWGLMLAAPAMLLRRWRRRRAVTRDRPLVARARHAKTTPSRDGPPSAAESPQPAPSAGANDATRSSAGARRSGGRMPPHRAGRSRGGSTPGQRLSTETLEPLCRYVDFSRRLELAVAELESRLSQLSGDRWRIEPYRLTGERRNTLLVLGETGVFVISATFAPGHWDDVIAASTLAHKVQLLLPGYPGQVRPAICHPFTSARPRLWHRPDEHGDWVRAWVLGGDSLIDWLEHFGTVHGLTPADLERFDELVKPDWLKPAIPTPPSWPPIPEAARPGRQQ